MPRSARFPLQILALGFAVVVCWTGLVAGWLMGADGVAAAALLAEATPFAVASLLLFRWAGWSRRGTLRFALALIAFVSIATFGYGTIFDAWNSLHVETVPPVSSSSVALPPVAG